MTAPVLPTLAFYTLAGQPASSRDLVAGKQCGEPTCYSFAIKLVASQKKLAGCPPLSESQHTEKLAALQDLIIHAPAIG